MIICLKKCAEEHLLLNRKSGLADASSRADRARRTAAVGACRMATTGLVSSMLTFDEDECLHWAKEVLPTCAQGVQAYCELDLEPPPAPPDDDWKQALCAPGLRSPHCGRSDWHSTLEHITDMPNVTGQSAR